MGESKGNWVVAWEGGCGVELILEVVMCHTNRFPSSMCTFRGFVMLGNHQGVRLASADEFWESMDGWLCM